MSILEVGHKTIRPGIQGIDDRLAIDWPGDLDATLLQIVRHWQNPPLPLAKFPGFVEKVRHFSPLYRFPAERAFPEQIHAPRVELPMETGKEFQRCGS